MLLFLLFLLLFLDSVAPWGISYFGILAPCICICVDTRRGKEEAIARRQKISIKSI